MRGYDLPTSSAPCRSRRCVHLLYSGELPDPAAARLIDAVMVACVDHGAGTPSVLAARTVISGGASLPAGRGSGPVGVRGVPWRRRGATMEIDLRGRRPRRAGSDAATGRRRRVVTAQRARGVDSPASDTGSTSVEIHGSTGVLEVAAEVGVEGPTSTRRPPSKPA